MSIFGSLAVIIGVGAVATLFIGLFTGDLLLMVFGGFNLLHAYAWGLVGDMREELDELKRRANNIFSCMHLGFLRCFNMNVKDVYGKS